MNQESPIHRYPAHSRAYLERAKGQLTKFDESGDVSAFFYAALELRYGIEAKVWEYLTVAFTGMGKDPASVSEFAASRLLKRLAKVDPQSKRTSVLKMQDQQSESITAVQYTPVSPELVSLHGKLGELLHYRFFIINPQWCVRRPMPPGGPRSLGNARVLLMEGIAGLEYATSGTLLANAKFTALVTEVTQESVGRGPAEDQ